ncbi:phytanoyl-CoA dioxygenase family protein [Pseudomonas coleopterorum]|uniref:phytanoyl-CoA dioxygenase family protein n=1 Tax=Pseudomonas coleopterorum TaxID=1605838 RepID=UPI00177F4DEF|nr:phytanoyl-CoA dioxygenase family protein [Pseudomonas coleopterorum]MBD8480382.1 phytanoyl-CoA dioxygenase family protein [Pseudomonas coleopterorum]
MSLIHLPSNVSIEEVVSCLDSEGYCIIDNAVSGDVVDAVNDQIQPYLERTPEGENNAVGKLTRRCGAVPARSAACHQMVMHPTVLGATRSFLGRNASAIQLNLTQLICIDPGQKAQFLHRDEGAWDWYDFFPVHYHVEVSTIWAMDDFTELNGATRVIPGSHKHSKLPLQFTQDDTFAAEMKKGSVLVYTGKTIHGGGENKSQASRRALNIDYCVGWVRQEENQYLSIPLEVAKKFPAELQDLMGYAMGAASMGYVREYEDPRIALHPDMPFDQSFFMDLLEKSSYHSAIAKSVFDYVKRK